VIDTNRPSLRTGDQILAVLEGRLALTAANLAKNQSWIAEELRKYEIPEAVERVVQGGLSLGLELPYKTKQQLLEDRYELSPMERFSQGPESAFRVDPQAWSHLVKVDPLAADIEAEIHAIRRTQTGRRGRN